jgi:folylpolyglutamate synthase/dihydropteroate synthase
LLTRAEYDRSADPDDLKQYLKEQRPRPQVFPTIPQAITRAMKEAGPEDLILISGSLFVVGEARAWWERMSRFSK